LVENRAGVEGGLPAEGLIKEKAAAATVYAQNRQVSRIRDWPICLGFLILFRRNPSF
jgi:hypothetical protein